MTKSERLTLRELILEAREWKALALIYRKKMRADVKRYKKEALTHDVELAEAQGEVGNIDACWRKALTENESLKKTLRFRADYKEKLQIAEDRLGDANSELKQLRNAVTEQMEKVQQASAGDPGLMAIRAVAARLGIHVPSPTPQGLGGSIQIGKLAPVKFDYARLQASIDSKLVELMARPG